MRRRLLIVQPVVPHYRVPFFRLLQGASEYDLDIAAAETFMGFTSTADLQHIRAPVRELAGGRLFWQSVDLSRLRRGDAVIFSGNARFLNLLPNMVEARMRGVRIGWWGHWKSAGSPKKGAALRHLLSRGADTLIMYSDSERSAAVRSGIPESRVFVAQNTIDDREIRRLVSEFERHPSAFPCELPFDTQQPFFLSVGRLIARKRVDIALRAVAAFPGTQAPAIVIVGDGPERPGLQRLAQELGLGHRAVFLGEVTHDRQLLPLFRRCVALVSSGPIGLAAPHSLAFHTPVVFVDTDNAPEAHYLIHERNALQCPQSVDGVHSAMGRLLAEVPLLNELRAGAVESAAREVRIEHMVEGFQAACAHLLQPANAQFNARPSPSAKVQLDETVGKSAERTIR